MVIQKSKHNEQIFGCATYHYFYVLRYNIWYASVSNGKETTIDHTSLTDIYSLHFREAERC